MQYWPRKRAKKPHARVRSWAKADTPMLGFAGYKVGMAHVMVTDNRKTSITKGETIAVPVTIIECPDLIIAGVNAYKNGNIATTVIKPNKLLKRRLRVNKGQSFELIEEGLENFTELRALVQTQPHKTGIGKKTPEIFEVALSGSVKDQFDFIKKKLGKEVSVSDVLKEGQQIDIHAVTKGKGFQGSVKRFGVSLRSHKSEKTKRGPGSLGPWEGQAHIMYRVAYPGQHGYHTRTMHNSWILKINAKNINPAGGFQNYGLVKSSHVLVKGSVPGARKRLLKLTSAIRPSKKIPESAPVIERIIVK